ncbi:MAG TPA: ATP-binding protein, partial [Verrucomicrobiota bacterium]|nr:ATP-binding protein [Verrucomicrobiota bacterium]
TLNAVRQFAEDRRLRLALTINPGLEKITADPDRIEKVFLNLLFNAMKFTPAGGLIRVQASADGDDALFEIVDTGVGMSPESIKHLFSRFWQADTSSQRKYQGVGIGLALVKELVEAHSGSVTGESQLGQGTTFRIRLPLNVQPDADEPPADATTPPGAPEPHQPHAVPPEEQAAWLSRLYRSAELFGNPTPLKNTLQHGAPPSRTGKPRVLIVDDEPDMVRFLRTLLDAHYEVIEAADGDQALTLAAQYLPDVIVCDFMLPHKDGLAVCHDLRSRELTRAIPVIILTARADEATKLRALEAGASDFLAKPFSIAELHVRVKNLGDGYRAAKALARQKQTLEATLEELHDTEAQLIQAAKMASLGRMSAGIIHEINNPLNYALTALSVLSIEARHLPPDNRGEFQETLKDVQDGLQRVGKIIADLREFTHPRGGDVEITEVNPAIEGALRFLRAEVNGKVEIDNQVPDGFAVRAVATKLMQVFVNLIQNSVDALREKTFPEGTKPRIRFEAAFERGTKTVKVWDNGPGIPASHISKVFDPFYTTKEVNQGTGMGLSICYRLLQDVGAQITVQSEPDVCCEFRITFPDPANDQIESSKTSTTIAA